MRNFLGSYSSNRLQRNALRALPVQRKVANCTCGQSIFFPNSECLACGNALGYAPDQGTPTALQPVDGGLWQLPETSSSLYRRCANLDTPAACNWLVPADAGSEFCLACQLNNTIPDLSFEGNGERWRKLELAKRQLVAQLLGLGLQVIPQSVDAERGLAFDFLAPDATGTPTTGHANGLITLNILEADDAHREKVRADMHEPYRTLLGHFRHEVGHYYFDRLVTGTDWEEPFRALFGDERADYGQALERHYQQGAPADWESQYVSAYATMHPWEDWAETWAHYLHMMDTLATAANLGMNATTTQLDFQPFTREALYEAEDRSDDEFLGFANAWIELAAMLNELSRSMGQPDFYPFALPAPVIAKLHFIHKVIHSAQPSVLEQGLATDQTTAGATLGATL
ncbi:zinc-binding metallopeptidase family protein [Pseudomonas oryzihabitans]|uniref:zinc-binding metallopeptidase family protein n=1 Tax=Pseudomonas oryzihabitans TaxID=47885 RepID=UPI002857E47B|nr:putative zinc-binding peptidase [Pseudomonas psychrotolerans]MDR6679810.1 hypothetical protein [Pseudomonas psychrotolerans]